MSETSAREFLSRVEGDEKFAGELEALKGDPDAVLARVRAAGFDAEPAEIRRAFIERYGAELSPEQLDAVAAGSDLTTAEAAALSGGVALYVLVGALGAVI
jgi:predicted ribosomally synthesized peptide with nif11-like leader